MIAVQSNRYGKSLLFVALLIAPWALPAQEKPLDLSGSVTTRSREPIRGAVVQLENENTQAIISYITDQRGRYEFKRIDANTDYHVWATYRGQRSKQRTLGKFNTKRNPRLDLVIKLP